MSKSLLRTIATCRTPTPPVTVRYDASSQTADVLEDGEWVKSWNSRALQDTKKCDHETGEDQKGA